LEASTDHLLALRDALRTRIRGELRLDALTRGLYATDGSMYQKMPLGVFFPRSAEDVQALVADWACRFCRAAEARLWPGRR